MALTTVGLSTSVSGLPAHRGARFGLPQDVYDAVSSSAQPPEAPLLRPMPQENIVCVRKPGEVQHPLVPLLFVGFSREDGSYIPHPRLRAQYPDDL